MATSVSARDWIRQTAVFANRSKLEEHSYIDLNMARVVVSLSILVLINLLRSLYEWMALLVHSVHVVKIITSSCPNVISPLENISLD